MGCVVRESINLLILYNSAPTSSFTSRYNLLAELVSGSNLHSCLSLSIQEYTSIPMGRLTATRLGLSKIYSSLVG